MNTIAISFLKKKNLCLFCTYNKVLSQSLDDTYQQRIIMRCIKNLECTQRLVWMGRNFILFQLVRSVRDLFQFNDPGILYTSNNQGNFHLK